MDRLIAMPLDAARAWLEQEGREYEIHYTEGGKDQALLTEPYVIRVREQEGIIQLMVTHFRTTIEPTAQQ